MEFRPLFHLNHKEIGFLVCFTIVSILFLNMTPADKFVDMVVLLLFFVIVFILIVIYVRKSTRAILTDETLCFYDIHLFHKEEKRCLNISEVKSIEAERKLQLASIHIDFYIAPTLIINKKEEIPLYGWDHKTIREIVDEIKKIKPKISVNNFLS